MQRTLLTFYLVLKQFPSKEEVWSTGAGTSNINYVLKESK